MTIFSSWRRTTNSFKPSRAKPKQSFESSLGEKVHNLSRSKSSNFLPESSEFLPGTSILSRQRERGCQKVAQLSILENQDIQRIGCKNDFSGCASIYKGPIAESVIELVSDRFLKIWSLSSSALSPLSDRQLLSNSFIFLKRF